MDELRLSIPDVYQVAQAVDKAIAAKVFSLEEIEQLFPAWTKVMAFCESVKRKSEIEEMYKKTLPSSAEGPGPAKEVESLEDDLPRLVELDPAGPKDAAETMTPE